MKADNSGLEASGWQTGNTSHFSRRASKVRLPQCRPQMLEHYVSSMMLGRATTPSIGSCDAQLSAARLGKIQLAAVSRGQYPGATISADVLPGVSSIGFWDASRSQDWGINARRNEGIEIRFVETGNMSFQVDETEFDLGAGDLAITRPWQWHQLGNPFVGAGRVHWLVLDVGAKNPNGQWRWPDWVTLTPADLAELTQKLRRNKTPVCKSTREIAQIFQQIAAGIVQWDNPHSVSRMTAYLNQLFVCLLDVPATQKDKEKAARSSSQQTVESFLTGLQDDPKNCEEIGSLQQMAERCGMGITAFAKHTREFANVGPMEFLKQCRLIHAARQLRERPDASITDVCFANGFNSSQYFATCFRKQFKMSPSEFLARRG